jgi:hypothetical protein
MPAKIRLMPSVVVALRDLVEEDGREEGAEDRHQVNEQAGLAGADFSDGAVVEDVAEKTGKDPGVGNGGQRTGRHLDRLALRDLPGVAGSERQRPTPSRRRAAASGGRRRVATAGRWCTEPR